MSSLPETLLVTVALKMENAGTCCYGDRSYHSPRGWGRVARESLALNDKPHKMAANDLLITFFK